MDITGWLERLRPWAPVPARGEGVQLRRWFLLDANRHAVTGVLLTSTFFSILIIGSIWPFEMQNLLTETQAVQTILVTFMSGIILLVSIVVSINSIVLSHDIAAVGDQQERIEEIMQFREEVGSLADTEETPTDPGSFLQVMADIIQNQAYELEGLADGAEEGFAEDVQAYVASTAGTAKRLELSLNRGNGGEFRALWLGLDTDYGPMMNRMRKFTSQYSEDLSESEAEKFSELMELFKMFATGREYFKTLYYNREIADLSRTLLVISLPSIIVTVATILAINANLLPDIWVFGLSPLMTFVAFTFTVALVPFVVLTSYMLRVATVTRRTAAAGPFMLK